MSPAAALLALLGAQADPAADRVVGGDLVLENGRVWTGEAFEDRALWIRDGRFVAERPPGDVRRVDLAGRWVVPPLAEAHTHRFSESVDAAGSREAFLASGVLYAANLCSPKDARRQCGEHVGGATGVDVLFTHGALTCTGGHPVRLYENLHSGVYRRPPETFRERNEDSTFYEVDDEAELDEKWALLLATEPDLVKTILSTSEEHAERRDDPRYYGARGLDPALLPAVVERARRAGLRVVTHVDTAADFRHALDAGVDVVAHTPGYDVDSVDELEASALTADDARRAAELGIVHVTTASVARSALAKELMAHNLRLLVDAGVTLAIGSDQWAGAAALERDALEELGILGAPELLRVWCEDTPRALFPGRAIGRLAPGYEGSLVVLGGDPLVDLEHLGDVGLVVKRGVVVWERGADQE